MEARRNEEDEALVRNGSETKLRNETIQLLLEMEEKWGEATLSERKSSQELNSIQRNRQGIGTMKIRLLLAMEARRHRKTQALVRKEGEAGFGKVAPPSGHALVRNGAKPGRHDSALVREQKGGWFTHRSGFGVIKV